MVLFLKLTGAVLVLIVSIGAGALALSALEKRFIFYKELCRYLTFLSEEISARSLPVQELLPLALERYPFSLLCLEKEQEAWMPVFLPFCTTAEAHFLSQCFFCLGSRNREDTLADLTYYRNCCQALADECAPKLSAARHLYLPLGASAGAVLSLLFL